MFEVSSDGPYKIVMKLNDVIIKQFLVRESHIPRLLFKP